MHLYYRYVVISLIFVILIINHSLSIIINVILFLHCIKGVHNILRRGNIIPLDVFLYRGYRMRLLAWISLERYTMGGGLSGNPFSTHDQKLFKFLLNWFQVSLITMEDVRPGPGTTGQTDALSTPTISDPRYKYLSTYL